MWQPATDKNYWNKLVSSQPHSRFLQSWQWGEFQESWGRQILRLSWNDEMLVQAIRMPLLVRRRGGTGGFFYWYIPHGPLVVKKQKNASDWSAGLKARLGHGALFVRVDPVTSPPPFQRPKEISFASATQPRCTRVLNLDQSEDDLLKQMHQKTRYNIRLAEKRGVAISEGSIDDFLRLNRETRSRDNFASHPDAYYQKMIASLPKNVIKIWQASYQNKVIASNIVIAFGDTATYAHGASSNEHKDVMAPHLLQWRTIQESKKQGIKRYDLWGVNPEDERHGAYKKSWQGITRFKAGFGGDFVCYPRSFDVIHRFWLYVMYTIVRKLRWYD